MIEEFDLDQDGEISEAEFVSVHVSQDDPPFFSIRDLLTTRGPPRSLL